LFLEQAAKVVNNASIKPIRDLNNFTLTP